MSTEDVKCEEVLASLDWLLSINSIKTEVWTALICPNNGNLQQALLMDWEDLIKKVKIYFMCNLRSKKMLYYVIIFYYIIKNKLTQVKSNRFLTRKA